MKDADWRLLTFDNIATIILRLLTFDNIATSISYKFARYVFYKEKSLVLEHKTLAQTSAIKSNFNGDRLNFISIT